MGAHRFHLPPDRWDGPILTLDGAEADHAAVLRLRAGDRVEVLDGEGRAATCRVLETGRRLVRLERVDEGIVPRPASLPVMALAASKAVRRGFFAEKAAELGAHEIWLWRGDRSQGDPPPKAGNAWTAQMIAGIKQCGNPWLPAVRVLRGLEDVTRLAAEADRRILPWELQDASSLVTPDRLGLPGVTVYVIGPEGGFSPRELDMLDAAGFERVSLGARILRCETAATLCLGLHWWASHLPGRAP